jgi:hypothetical protein
MAPRSVHPLVTALATGLNAPAVSAMKIKASSPEALAYSSNLPEAIMFAGFLGGVVQEPSGRNWQLLYLDLELNDWLLIEEDGVLAEDEVVDDGVPFNQRRDVIWVKADAAVGRGSASQSAQAQFLTGDFTRAGDFEAPAAGGTLAAATGVFCNARTAGCCRRKSY